MYGALRGGCKEGESQVLLLFTTICRMQHLPFKLKKTQRNIQTHAKKHK